jgi:hypothetical protein
MTVPATIPSGKWAGTDVLDLWSPHSTPKTDWMLDRLEWRLELKETGNGSGKYVVRDIVRAMFAREWFYVGSMGGIIPYDAWADVIQGAFPGGDPFTMELYDFGVPEQKRWHMLKTQLQPIEGKGSRLAVETQEWMACGKWGSESKLAPSSTSSANKINNPGLMPAGLFEHNGVSNTDPPTPWTAPRNFVGMSNAIVTDLTVSSEAKEKPGKNAAKEEYAFHVSLRCERELQAFRVPSLTIGTHRGIFLDTIYLPLHGEDGESDTILPFQVDKYNVGAARTHYAWLLTGESLQAIEKRGADFVLHEQTWEYLSDWNDASWENQAV